MGLFDGFKKKQESEVAAVEPFVDSMKTNIPESTADVGVTSLPEILPEPAVIEAAPTPPIVEQKTVVVDALSMLYFVWMLYKLNIITRIQIKDFLDIVRRGDWPKDVLKYLQDEVKKI